MAMTPKEVYAYYLQRIGQYALLAKDKQAYKDNPVTNHTSSWTAAVDLIARTQVPVTLTKSYKMATYADNYDEYYLAALLMGLQHAYDAKREQWPKKSSVDDAQNMINTVTGSDQILLQDALNKAVARADNIQSRLQKPFTSYYMGLNSPLDAITNRIGNYVEAIKSIIEIGKNAQYVAQQQALAREALRREAEGLVEYTNSLIAQVTGGVKSDFSNTLQKLVQMDYVPQIEGLKNLIVTVENQLRLEYEERERAKFEQFLLQSEDNKQALQELMNQMPADMKNMYMQLLAEIEETFAAGQYTQNQYLSELNNLLNVAMVSYARYRFDRLVADMNKLVSTLPVEYAQALFDQIVNIVETTTDSYSSLQTGINKLNNIAPQVDMQLALLSAEKIETVIATSEAERQSAIESAIDSQTAALQSAVMQEANKAADLLTDLPTDLYNYYNEKMLNPPALLNDQLAYYKALQESMRYAVSLRTQIENMTAEEITGLQYDLDTDLHDSINMIQDKLESTSAVAAPAGAGAAPLLAALFLAINFLG